MVAFVFWLNSFLVVIVGIGSAKLLSIKDKKGTIDRIGMGIFRDIGRYKAMKRRNMNTKGLISTLLKHDNNDELDEELRQILNTQQQQQANGDDDPNNSNHNKPFISFNDLPTYTIDELYEFGNGQNENPILIGILGYVYDVTKGSKFYGSTGNYYMFAGHDITYSLATGCKTQYCVETTININNNDADQEENVQLTVTELKEAKRWLSFFHMHDKYPLIGKMESNYVDLLLDELLTRNSNNDTTSNDNDNNDLLNEKSQETTTTSRSDNSGMVDEQESEPVEVQ